MGARLPGLAGGFLLVSLGFGQAQPGGFAPVEVEQIIGLSPVAVSGSAGLADGFVLPLEVLLLILRCPDSGAERRRQSPGGILSRRQVLGCGAVAPPGAPVRTG